MKNELFPFQKTAVSELRSRAAMAQDSYQKFKLPQVISLQAPTGSGKTIIMASLIEDVYFGSTIITPDNEKENRSRFIYPKKKKYNNKANKFSTERRIFLKNRTLFSFGFLTRPI